MRNYQDFLTDVEYPCRRDEILRRAAANGAGDNVLGRLSTLPERDYDCLDTVHSELSEEFGRENRG
ncbi:DUF2795 domain-containing protein [Amycolatopsis sp. CA-230715]|uniref:DUF2795 domain-containing protein n=1 Tax=Amycolatopsis sp. CA-230715 TaxID=2745196 RepID=UPI001C32E2AA|nr:DUF2795 domain-containing protein [Amycolatopsis sp. CA-230715]QWF82689.1 hypothetical protein HUW46_06128 [Amycolatopsis sp. CA-230715]